MSAKILVDSPEKEPSSPYQDVIPLSSPMEPHEAHKPKEPSKEGDKGEKEGEESPHEQPQEGVGLNGLDNLAIIVGQIVETKGRARKSKLEHQFTDHPLFLLAILLLLPSTENRS